MIDTTSYPEPEDLQPVRRALLSVFDKTGVVEFARVLHRHDVELISTGGTARTLLDAGLPVTPVSELTGYPEILGGRVKTLHPVIHGGILARRSLESDVQDLEEQHIGPIDLIAVNLYPFEEAVSGDDATDALAVENIDIGGPTMLRAAAKNFFFTTVVCSPQAYRDVTTELEQHDGHTSLSTRRRLALDVFRRTSAYDAAIATWLDGAGESVPRDGDSTAAPLAGDPFELSLPLAGTLRYGENPHQKASLFGRPDRFFEKLHGKDLSFNNLLDLGAALLLIDEFRDADPAVAILKHTNPCGVATARTLEEAYELAFETDRQSPFGGIVIVNRPLDMATAESIDRVFTEIIIAPEFEDGVLDFLMQKKNRRLVRRLRDLREDEMPDIRSTVAGLLVQDRDPVLPPFEDLRKRSKVVTKRQPTEDEWRDLDFAWRVAKHVKSNAIVYAGGGRTLGIGAGQMSRIDASEVAVSKGAKSELDFSGSVVASDAFFPFPDGLLEAAAAGARAAIQPGGSVRDDEVIRAADDEGLAMVFTGYRHFRH
ncbi:MAG: bifunctional phosphoribosylaminoimidazolecarboxamide formyltransferase/IMP cyclohydrolase [Rhodothermales bacterium]|nr:bifunctional phosphoribosylaminoimidazolecarboxamide formyltransferase/IMP cyclohydrolase [Rhodothermales bacterium]